MNMKKKIINAAVCDARDVTEEALDGFDSITVNAATLITSPRATALLNRYPVTMNVAGVVEIPDGQDIVLQSVNGKGEIGPGANGTGVFLVVNGKLTIADGSREAVRSYYRIMVNGKVLMPKSCQGQFPNLTVNGKTDYYPDGAFILKPDTQIDALFTARASASLYCCPGILYFLDAGLDADTLREKGIRFSAAKAVIAEGLLAPLLPLLNEEAKIVRVPDGTRFLDDDLELLPRTIRKFGTKLCVCGDVTIQDAEALSALEYLFADGTVRVSKNLADAFDEIESVYDELKIVDPDIGEICDLPAVKVGTAVLNKYPNGLRITDCARVTLAEELCPEDIMEKLRIADCALVVCTKEQEEAVCMVAVDVAMIRTAQVGDGETADAVSGGTKDALVINAAEYKM